MKYVALLRGIGPNNPNMHQQKLVGVFEGLGFKNVRGVISSGNVLFESRLQAIPALEKRIETAWPKKLGFTSTTIIRSQKQIQSLVSKKPFGSKAFSKKNYQIVTFLKKGGELFNTVDTTATKMPNVMLKLEKEYGRGITTRTWNTIMKIHRLLENK